MVSIFTELQMQSSNSMNTVASARKKMNELLQCFLAMPDREMWCKIFAEDVRNLEVKTFLDCDSFMIQPDTFYTSIPQELKADTYGMFRDDYCIFEGRYVYPVKDPSGDVMGWCGYDKFSDIKYLDSINYGYKAKNSTFWGMEKIEEYYRSNRQVFITEGIVCALYARQCGEQALATLGSMLSPYMVTVINRFGTRARIITDSDIAGNKFKRMAQKLCPQARVLQSRISKDLDDSRKLVTDMPDELRKLENRFYKSPYFT